MSNVQFFAGIGKRKITTNIEAVDISTSRYTGAIKAQFDAILENYRKFIKGLDEATGDVLLEALKPTFELSQSMVPVDSGALKASGHLEKETFGGTTRVVMGYAKGGNPPYAILVHERVDIPHKEPTRSKFLLAALEQDAPNIQRRIIDAYKRITGAGL